MTPVKRKVVATKITTMAICLREIHLDDPIGDTPDFDEVARCWESVVSLHEKELVELHNEYLARMRRRPRREVEGFGRAS